MLGEYAAPLLRMLVGRVAAVLLSRYQQRRQRRMPCRLGAAWVCQQLLLVGAHEKPRSRAVMGLATFKHVPSSQQRAANATDRTGGVNDGHAIAASMRLKASLAL